MSDSNFILHYVVACFSGNLPFSECGPVWQFGAIAVFLIVAIVFLVILILQGPQQPAQG